MEKYIRPPRTKLDNVSEITTYTLPYLELEFFWNNENKLELKVHQRANKNIKHINKSITHTNKKFKAIPIGIFNWLAKLTSKSRKFSNESE